MTQHANMMLTATYFAAAGILCAGWLRWRRSVDRLSLGLSVQRLLISGYWILVGTMVGGTIASLQVGGDDLSGHQFRTLTALVIGMVPQAGLLALVITPIAMQGRSRDWTFGRALVAIECGVVLPVSLLAGALCWLAANQEKVAQMFSH